MEALLLALSFAGKLMDKMPNYEQKKRSEFKKLKTSYLEERAKTYQERDDDLLLSLKEELEVFLEAFEEEIKGE